MPLLGRRAKGSPHVSPHPEDDFTQIASSNGRMTLRNEWPGDHGQPSPPGSSSTIDRRMSTCIVTGGAGFLGSHLCETLLERGHRVLCIGTLQRGSRPNFK